MNKKQQEENVEEQLGLTAEELATSIAKISRSMEILSQSRLKRKTILILLSNYTKLPQRDIDLVLNSLGELEKTYLKY